MRSRRQIRKKRGVQAEPFAPVPKPLALLQAGVVYLVQIFLNYIAPMFVDYFLGAWLQIQVIKESSASANVAAHIGEAIVVAFAGLLLGLVIWRLFPSARKTGPWIWIPLVALLLLASLSDYSQYGFHAMVDEYFFVFKPGWSESGWGIFLATFPAWSSIWYSLASGFANRHARRRAYAAASRQEDRGR
jgi:hypothetical protein